MERRRVGEVSTSVESDTMSFSDIVSDSALR